MGAIKTIPDLIKNVDTKMLMDLDVTDWRPILAKECQVFVMGENYIAKRFDQINFKFCDKDTAREILVDNLYSLLRYKYFPKASSSTDEKIKEIIDSFVLNLKTTLKKVTLKSSGDGEKVSFIPNGCMAFRNGVFDFKNNKWLFKYDIIRIENLSNSIYMYSPEYLITWYMDYDFEPIEGIDINELSLEDFILIMKELVKDNHNYCFELLYNMAHTSEHKFSMKLFRHLCEILGYTCYQDFCQSFVMFVGSGQNGKNSLFDGCFINNVVPTPAAIDLNTIETDQFVTGSLENKAHNIYLESTQKTYTESKTIKAITGSMYQSIHIKGIQKYSGMINCKYIFSCNEQEKLKFTDNSPGFRRRINVIEIWYHWDPQKHFMKQGDYYDTTFSDDLNEIKDDINNTSIYIYFAMYGIKIATKDFTHTFRFTENDWKLDYSDIDFDLKEKIENISTMSLVSYLRTNRKKDEAESLMYDLRRARLQNSYTLKRLGYEGIEGIIQMLSDEESYINYFSENDVYISIRALQSMCGDIIHSGTAFTQLIKKTFAIPSLQTLNANKPYVKCNFVTGKLKILS